MKQKILIVDDSATARALFKIYFMHRPEYEIIQASNWREAVEKAVSEQPFLIVLDYNMPEKSGSDVARMIQEKGVQAYFVLITANTQQSIIDEVKALGFFDIIEKPIVAEHIQSLLEKLQ
jgi:CheY-like chemotaxis protein